MKKYCVLVLAVLLSCSDDLPKNSNYVETKLYLGKKPQQPLIVAFGGADGGNSWTIDRVKDKRDSLISKGYAFLAVGYFNTDSTPKELDRISIDVIHNAIVKAAKNPQVNEKKIALLGMSKGAELALLLASKYNDISCVIAMSPGNVVFPAHTISASTSSWSMEGEEIPYVPMKMSAIPSVIKNDLRSAYMIMLEDKKAVEKALIHVENIAGPILFLSAKEDEFWPSTEMSNAMTERLYNNSFRYYHNHIAIEGGHYEVFDHFDAIYQFLEVNFPAK